jgi:hypothetical protein
VFDGIKLRMALWKLEKSKAKTLKEYAKSVAEVRKRKGTAEEIYQIGSDENFEVTMIDEQIYLAHTNFLRSEANRLIIPIPDFSDKSRWDMSNTMGFGYLTAFGINELRTAIRAERKLRREALLMWLPAAGAVTGLIGAMTGLIAVWSRTPH